MACLFCTVSAQLAPDTVYRAKPMLLTSKSKNITGKNIRKLQKRFIHNNQKNSLPVCKKILYEFIYSNTKQLQ